MALERDRGAGEAPRPGSKMSPGSLVSIQFSFNYILQSSGDFIHSHTGKIWIQLN